MEVVAPINNIIINKRLISFNADTNVSQISLIWYPLLYSTMEVRTIPAKKPKYRGIAKTIEPIIKIKHITIIAIGFNTKFLSNFLPHQKNI